MTWNANTNFPFFITSTIFDPICDKFIPPEDSYSSHWKAIANLSLSAILNFLVCYETRDSNQNTHPHWLKREFRDVMDVLVYWDIPDCLLEFNAFNARPKG